MNVSISPANGQSSAALPAADEFGQRFRIELRPAKEMHVIGHDDIATNGPAMTLMSQPPFFD